MKANAPEKIYVGNYSSGLTYNWHNKRLVNDIEYIRTDAFIEKIQSFLNKKDDRDSYTIDYIKKHLQEIIKEVVL